MTEIVQTNKPPHKRLTNVDISTHYRYINIYIMPSELLGAFAYWCAYQFPIKHHKVDIDRAINAFDDYLMTHFDSFDSSLWVDYDLLSSIINEDSFEKIPEIKELNTLDGDFIDLGALARNVFYMILRERIIQDD